MYEPRLPISGYPLAVLVVTPFVSKVAYMLLVITCLLVIFRFTRLLYKEKKLINLIYIALVIITIACGTYIYKTNQVNRYSDIDIKSEYTTQKLEDQEEIILNSGDYIGTLAIEKIALELDVVEEASDENMFIGAGHVLSTPYPWQDGNSFIASHNVKNYGLLFNRLKELEIGDSVTFTSDKGIQRYEVYDIEVVDGDNTSCFDKLDGKRNLSLVTCSDEKRLIVYCKEVN